jgi:hypothetical protein
MLRAVWLFLIVAACREGPSNRLTRDGAYARVQERGRQAMGVDQYTSFHRFEPLPDGGRIVLERDPGDRAGVAQIREHMQQIAASFRAGDFAVPGFVHDREVPGTRVMTARRERISYTPDTTPGGGQLRIVSQDPEAIAAIHQFLAFQRQDHRAGPGGNTH